MKRENKMKDVEAYVAYPPIIIRNESNEIRYVLKNDYHPNDPEGFSLEIIGEYITNIYFHNVKVSIHDYGFLEIGVAFFHENKFIASINISLEDYKSEKNKRASNLLIKLIKVLEDCKLVEYREKTIEDLLGVEFQ